MAYTLSFYTDIGITEDKNMIIEDINDFLSAREPAYSQHYFPNTQRNKDEHLGLEMKVIIQQSLNYVFLYTYCVYSSTGSKAFYFIKNFSYISDGSCELTLKMDVLNTYYRYISASFAPSIVISSRTHITRCHKPRFDFMSGTEVRATIDAYSEGINPKLFLKEKYIINQKVSNDDFNYHPYLVYLTKDSTIKCFLLFDEAFPVLPHNNPNSYKLTLATLKELDKSDSRLIKIIKIPYTATGGFTKTTDVGGQECYTYDTNIWHFDEYEGWNRLILIDTFTELINDELYDEIDATSPSYMIHPLIFTNYANNVFTKSKTDARGASGDDTKLLHSEFYYWKYIYDSFTKVIRLENELPSNKYLPAFHTSSYSKLPLTFYVTNTINSRFMFKFNYFRELEFTDEDYDLFLVIQRNNEMVMYNDAYVNYIRSGYNYDVKNKERQETFAWITAGAGLLTAGFGAVTGNPLAIVGGSMALSSAINQTISAEMNLEQKINQLKWQSASVFGADDVDLMTHYAHNKLWRAKYEISDRMKNLLNDLFFYTGYIEDKFSNNIMPKTRIWFDYIKADVVIKKFLYAKNSEQLEEFKKKYAEGVTIFHKQMINNVATWDIYQEKENWEIEFFN